MATYPINPNPFIPHAMALDVSPPTYAPMSCATFSSAQNPLLHVPYGTSSTHNPLSTAAPYATTSTQNPLSRNAASYATSSMQNPLSRNAASYATSSTQNPLSRNAASYAPTTHRGNPYAITSWTDNPLLRNAAPTTHHSTRNPLLQNPSRPKKKVHFELPCRSSTTEPTRAEKVERTKGEGEVEGTSIRLIVRFKGDSDEDWTDMMDIC
ncbi:MAG: hypothetical protein M1818_004326 [Claussenomyces sp. TS43310]|nr:MAG: hypothetical protein M1818_004326 [Claussenomyces sp. TS43310]